MAFNFGKFSGALAGSADSNGGIDYGSLGETAGSFLPIPFGGAIGKIGGSVLGKLGGLFGGHGVANHEAGDIGTIAAATGLSDAQVKAVTAYEESNSPENWDSIVKRYANNIASFSGALNKYNQNHQGMEISVPLAAPIAPLVVAPAYETQQVPAPTSAQFHFPSSVIQPFPLGTTDFAGGAQMGFNQSVNNSFLKDLLNGSLNGARNGATDVFMKTQAGKDAQNAGAKQWFADNGLIIGLALIPIVALFTWLAGRAFKK